MDKTTAASFLKDLWTREVTRAAEANLVLAKLVSRFDPDVKGGKSATIPNVSNLVANDKISNTAVVLQAPTEGKVTINLDKHKHVAFIVEDIVKAQTNYNLLSEYTNKTGYALRKAIETDLANLATGFSTSKGTYNTTITTTAVLDAVQTLDDADVPMEERFWYLKPHAVNDLRTISDYTRYDGTGFAGGAATGAIGDGKIRPNGLVGMLYNAPVYMSTQAYQTGNNISNIYAHKEALALAIQEDVRVQSDNRIDYLGTLVVADTIYGVTERRDDHGVEFRN